MFATLPRYTFRESGVGCGQHPTNPDCLCDVVITQPVEFQTDTVLLFAQSALNEIDAETVTNYNFHEFASVLLGLYETMVDTGSDDAETVDTVTARFGRVSASPLWDSLDDRTVRALRAHYRAGSPWEVAVRELAGMSADNLSVLQQQYMKRRKQAFHDKRYRSENRKNLVTVSEGMISCVVCGVPMVNVNGRRETCSSACKQRKYRNSKKGK